MQNLKSNLGVWEQICEEEGRWDGGGGGGGVCDDNDDENGKEEEEESDDDVIIGGIPSVLIAVMELDHENDDYSDIDEEDDDVEDGGNE